ncbi:NAD(P)-dependent oxidoreductase [Paenibacillus sp. 1011MAR3C5]|uniref:NAD(P)-dependent oxidoreductase n=1 Tax=Paenibacillus sp. 1011MAR3C5 TaxID=1675787 RepID=UPI000E6CE401|nr:NAD(P)-dependent oxidoreductase [Paenibacillus sp. 1011MAR3C5]RJE87554.1 NAD(P)-dependent oxidoreductase [Paenibacillus sp. 1011MAR3C5]
MKIAIVGASGKAGKLIAQEALSRGHEVTAIVRNKASVQVTGAAVLEKDVFDLKQADLTSFDVVVNAFGAAPGQEHLHVDAGNALIEALKGTSVRLFVVGGAGSLFVDEAKSVRVFETPDFPAAYLTTAQNQGKNLEILQNQQDVTWTFLSPSAFFHAEGRRTGAYESGQDHLLINSKGDSYISYADYAIAVVDEIENPKHLNERYTVVGEA